jgi:hypothetical protein
MPSGNVVLFDQEYDEMVAEALTLSNPNEYFTILYDTQRRPSGVMYNNGDLYNYSYLWGKYVKCMPMRDLEVCQE